MAASQWLHHHLPWPLHRKEDSAKCKNQLSGKGFSSSLFLTCMCCQRCWVPPPKPATKKSGNWEFSVRTLMPWMKLEPWWERRWKAWRQDGHAMCLLNFVLGNCHLCKTETSPALVEGVLESQLPVLPPGSLLASVPQPWPQHIAPHGSRMQAQFGERRLKAVWSPPFLQREDGDMPGTGEMADGGRGGWQSAR